MAKSKVAPQPAIHCQGFEGNPWDEWNRLRQIPHLDVRHMPAGRTFTTVLTDCGVELATKTEISTRGRVTQINFMFTGKVRPNYEKAVSHG